MDLNMEAELAQRAASEAASSLPEAYKKTPDGNFTMNESIEDIFKAVKMEISDEELATVTRWVMHLVAKAPTTEKQFQKEMTVLRRQDHCAFKKSRIGQVYHLLVKEGKIFKNEALRQLLVKKAQKSQSGVLVVTVLTSPYPESQGKKQRFSCQWNCYYCPNEPNQPRSYLHDEPSVLRANRNKFDPVLQFFDRLTVLELNGHPADKIELLVLGGTWASYPHDYQESFIRDLFFAANTFFDRVNRREKGTLEEEKLENESAECKIIGITLETRPDCIDADEIRRFRRYGCTRVQLGIQHTYESVLTKINRACYTEDTIRAIRLLKDNCYKIDIHIMPNLPGSDVAMDRDMFNRVLDDPDLQADQWKIYPCEVTPWTVIKKWFEAGTFRPYPEADLLELLMDVKALVHPWIRLNRVIRDIPSQYILGGVANPSMRQVLARTMKEQGRYCRCIRCREVKGKGLSTDDTELVVRSYMASGALEYFVSIETRDRMTICGFARLRIPRDLCATDEVREYLTEVTPGRGDYVNLDGRAEAEAESCLLDNEAEEEEDDIDVSQMNQVDEDDDDEAEVDDDAPVFLSTAARVRSKSPSLRRRRRTHYTDNANNQNTTTEPKRPIAAPSTQASGLSGWLRTTFSSPTQHKQTTKSGAKNAKVERIFPELLGAALVRELHVYGQLVATADKQTKKAQHVGYGTQLMNKVEELSILHGATSTAVISGVGVRNFYRKLGYELSGEGEMMIKPLSKGWGISMPVVVVGVILNVVLLLVLLYGLVEI